MPEVKSIVAIETLLNASPVFMFALYKLLQSKGMRFNKRYAGMKAKNISVDKIYSTEYISNSAANISPNASGPFRAESRQSSEVPALGSQPRVLVKSQIEPYLGTSLVLE